MKKLVKKRKTKKPKYRWSSKRKKKTQGKTKGKARRASDVWTNMDWPITVVHRKSFRRDLLPSRNFTKMIKIYYKDLSIFTKSTTHLKQNKKSHRDPCTTERPLPPPDGAADTRWRCSCTGTGMTCRWQSRSLREQQSSPLKLRIDLKEPDIKSRPRVRTVRNSNLVVRGASW